MAQLHHFGALLYLSFDPVIRLTLGWLKRVCYMSSCRVFTVHSGPVTWLVSALHGKFADTVVGWYVWLDGQLVIRVSRTKLSISTSLLLVCIRSCWILLDKVSDGVPYNTTHFSIATAKLALKDALKYMWIPFVFLWSCQHDPSDPYRPDCVRCWCSLFLVDLTGCLVQAHFSGSLPG